MTKRDLLIGMLKDTDDTVRHRAEERRSGGADDSTQALLLDLLKDVDQELERRIS